MLLWLIVVSGSQSESFSLQHRGFGWSWVLSPDAPYPYLISVKPSLISSIILLISRLVYFHLLCLCTTFKGITKNAITITRCHVDHHLPRQWIWADRRSDFWGGNQKFDRQTYKKYKTQKTQLRLRYMPPWTPDCSTSPRINSNTATLKCSAMHLSHKTNF